MKNLKLIMKIKIVLIMLINSALSIGINKVFLSAGKEIFDFDSNEDILKQERVSWLNPFIKYEKTSPKIIVNREYQEEKSTTVVNKLSTFKRILKSTLEPYNAY